MSGYIEDLGYLIEAVRADRDTLDAMQRGVQKNTQKLAGIWEGQGGHRKTKMAHNLRERQNTLNGLLSKYHSFLDDVEKDAKSWLHKEMTAADHIADRIYG